jgi:hypothetical protein
MSMYGPPGGPYPGQPQDPWQGGQPQDPYGPQHGDPYGQQPPPWGGQQPNEPWGGGQSPGPPTSGPPSSGPPASPGPYYGGSQPTYGGQPGYGGGQPLYGGGQPGYGGGQPTYAGQPDFGQQSPYHQPTSYSSDNWLPQQPPPRKRGSGLLVTVIVVLAVLVCGGGAAGAYFLLKGRSSATASRAGNAGASATPTGAAPTTAAPSPSQDDTGEDDAVAAKAGDCLVNQGTNDKPLMQKVTCAAGAFEVLKRFDGTDDVKKCDGVKDYAFNYTFKSDIPTKNFVLCMKKRA